jgi:dihydropteroate synthase
MTVRLHPLPRTGIGGLASGLPLAGSRYVWFDEVAEGGQIMFASPLPPEMRMLLSTRRPDLCGLSLDRPRIMGILNVTPDSFSDGGDHAGIGAALERARALAEKADILDIGGESTRPGAEPVPVAEEIRRTVPVIEAIRAAGITIPISIDTRKARVAEAALEAGADMINDVAAFTYDPELADLAAERSVPVCLMHAKGRPETMQHNPHYDDVVAEVHGFLAERIDFAIARGICKESLVVDPGIGFGKTSEHNLALLRNLAVFHNLGPPILVGASRKRFIGTIGGAADAKDRTPGSLAVALHAASQGAQIIRVHDVSETAQALALFKSLVAPEAGVNSPQNPGATTI